MDPILEPSQYDLGEYVQNPVQFAQYLYVGNRPIIAVDLLGQYLIVKYKDENNKFGGYALVPENLKNVLYNCLSNLPLGKWFLLSWQKIGEGAVGGTGIASIDMLTIFNDSSDMSAGMMSIISEENVDILGEISPTLGATVGKVSIFIMVVAACTDTVKTFDRTVYDKILVEILNATGYGTAFSDLTTLQTVVDVIDKRIENDYAYFEKPYCKLVFGTWSPALGRTDSVFQMPTLWEISSNANKLSVKDYNDFIDPYIYLYNLHLPLAFKYPDNPNSHERYTDNEIDSMSTSMENNLKQSHMSQVFISRMNYIKSLIKQELNK